MNKRFKRFDIVKIINKKDTHFGRLGVIVTIAKSSNYPFHVCFGTDKWDNGIIGFYDAQDLYNKK